MISLRHRLEAADAEQERRKRRENERRENTPAKERKRVERQREREESNKRYTERWEAERADLAEPPLYEVILDHVDIAAPRLESLRRRLIIAIKHEIADLSWLTSRSDAQRLARAKEILSELEGPSSTVEPVRAGEGE